MAANVVQCESSSIKLYASAFSNKKMTWQLMWCNVRAAALNSTFQLLVIYRFGERM